MVVIELATMGGIIYAYYRMFKLVLGPERRFVGRNNSDPSEREGKLSKGGSSDLDPTEEAFLRHLDVDLSVIQLMEPNDRIRYIDSKIQGIGIAKCQQLLESKRKFGTKEPRFADFTIEDIDEEKEEDIFQAEEATSDEVSCDLQAYFEEEHESQLMRNFEREKEVSELWEQKYKDTQLGTAYHC